MTLEQLENTMSAREFYLWVGFDSLSPIGDERGDIHSAQIASSVYQSQGGKVSMKELILDWSSDKQLQNNGASLEGLFEKLANK